MAKSQKKPQFGSEQEGAVGGKTTGVMKKEGGKNVSGEIRHWGKKRALGKTRGIKWKHTKGTYGGGCGLGPEKEGKRLQKVNLHGNVARQRQNTLNKKGKKKMTKGAKKREWEINRGKKRAGSQKNRGLERGGEVGKPRKLREAGD